MSTLPLCYCAFIFYLLAIFSAIRLARGIQKLSTGLSTGRYLHEAWLVVQVTLHFYLRLILLASGSGSGVGVGHFTLSKVFPEFGVAEKLHFFLKWTYASATDYPGKISDFLP
jgi:hypothetical protein